MSHAGTLPCMVRMHNLADSAYVPDLAKLRKSRWPSVARPMGLRAMSWARNDLMPSAPGAFFSLPSSEYSQPW